MEIMFLSSWGYSPLTTLKVGHKHSEPRSKPKFYEDKSRRYKLARNTQESRTILAKGFYE